jgi:CheY-like chemotaxis protein
LVVDDSDDVRELMRLQLLFAGYRVLEARDGAEAVETARRECPDLILMNIHMPVMDGIAATRLLRQAEGLCEVVIVAFSALTSGDHRGSALATGCDAFANKMQGILQPADTVRRILPAA